MFVWVFAIIIVNLMHVQCIVLIVCVLLPPDRALDATTSAENIAACMGRGCGWETAAGVDASKGISPLPYRPRLGRHNEGGMFVEVFAFIIVNLVRVQCIVLIACGLLPPDLVLDATTTVEGLYRFLQLLLFIWCMCRVLC